MRDELLGPGVGVNIHSTDDGRTALHKAAEEGPYETVCALVLGGAYKDGRSQQSWGGNAADACSQKKATCLSWIAVFLVGVDLNIHPTDDGSTALHLAANAGASCLPFCEGVRTRTPSTVLGERH